MPTDRSFLDYVVEQSGLEGALTFKRLFGEYALYLDGKVVAFACDNSLLLKPSTAMPDVVSRLPGRPPYPGAKDYPVLDELLDEPDALRRILRSTADALPLPRPKPAKKARKRAGKSSTRKDDPA
jgi:TfoX/Sxy family transcriptional regulator of competence genes